MPSMLQLIPSDSLPEVEYAFAARGCDEDWTVVRFELREALSSLFECRVVLATPAVRPLDQLVGAPAELLLTRGDGERRVRGVVSRVEDLGSLAVHHFVRVTVVPALWLLSQRVDCRIFQQRNVPAIVREVLASAGLYQGRDQVRIDRALEALPPREYCVQYRESDLAFVTRLLEDEGIPFWFEHEARAGEVLVLAADTHRYVDVTAGEGVLHVADERAATATTETVRWLDWQRELRPTAVTLRDFDFTRPRATAPDMTAEAVAEAANPRALYEYPARVSLTHYDDARQTYGLHTTRRLARVRMEEQRTREQQARGQSNVTGLAPGRAFALAGHVRSERDQRHVVTRVEHQGDAWGDIAEGATHDSERLEALLRAAGAAPGAADRRRAERYSNRFDCNLAESAGASVPFRPARTTPRPLVEGPQTATVVGPASEEIHVDAHGRIKVQFHWDREGGFDEDSSCWVRVAQAWAGSGWGGLFVPRIGMEVVVVFLEGDPDRPLVVGTVYNGDNPPPYALPAEKTRSTLRTNSTPSTGGYNEIRFEDAAGSEQLYVQAERDHDTLVKHCQTLHVGANRSKSIGRNESNSIGARRTTTVGGDDSLTVTGDADTTVHGPKGASVRVDQLLDVSVGQYSHTVERDHDTMVMADQSLTVVGNRARKVHGADTSSVDGARSVSVRGNDSHAVTGSRSASITRDESLSVEGNWSVSVNGYNGASIAVMEDLNLSGGQKLTLSVGKSTIVLTAHEIAFSAESLKFTGQKDVVIQGGVVKINCETPPPAAPAKKPGKLAALLAKVQRGVKRVLGKLPPGLRNTLEKLARRAANKTVAALKQGKLPDFKAMGREALEQTSRAAVSAAFAELGTLGPLQNKVGRELLARAQSRVTGAVQDALRATALFRDAMAESPEWAVVEREHGDLARTALGAMAAPLARAAALEADAIGSAQGDPELIETAGDAPRTGLAVYEKLLADGVGRAVTRAVRTGVEALVPTVAGPAHLGRALSHAGVWPRGLR